MYEIDTPVLGQMPLSFFDKAPLFGIPEKGLFRIYNDGSHYVGTLVESYASVDSMSTDTKQSKKRRKAFSPPYKQMFDEDCETFVRDGLRGRALEQSLNEKFAGIIGSDSRDYVQKRIKQRYHNLHARLKRFRRKAYLNPWNYFVTITYDSGKCSEEVFRARLKRCLSNLATRRGWRYMGVFERAPKTDRLHFHALMFVPEYEMIGELVEVRDYSTETHQMQTTTSNTFFAARFGRNDFSRLCEADLKYGNTTDYICKYIGKTGERITYSRGIRTDICLELNFRQIAVEMQDYVKKYVICDDVIDRYTDVLRCKYVQCDIFSHPA